MLFWRGGGGGGDYESGGVVSLAAHTGIVASTAVNCYVT